MYEVLTSYSVSMFFSISLGSKGSKVASLNPKYPLGFEITSNMLPRRTPNLPGSYHAGSVNRFYFVFISIFCDWQYLHRYLPRSVSRYSIYIS